MDEIKEQKCNYCKVMLPIYKFSLNRKDKYNKSCDECRIKQKINRNKRKCEHNREKSKCKECGGSQICEHNRKKSSCKECGGGSICEHNKHKSICKECGGSQICEHGRRRSRCKECGGGSICEHNRHRSSCKECGGGSICEHNKHKSICKECGGVSICEHNRIRSKCKECGGGSICEHGREKSRCKECDPIGYLSAIVRSAVYNALKNDKELSSKEYLGCNIEEFKEHIENQFTEGMSWDNYGEFHIDHIIPLKYKENGIPPTIEEVIKRLHFSNTQPMWASENIAKGNRFIG